MKKRIAICLLLILLAVVVVVPILATNHDDAPAHDIHIPIPTFTPSVPGEAEPEPPEEPPPATPYAHECPPHCSDH